MLKYDQIVAKYYNEHYNAIEAIAKKDMSILDMVREIFEFTKTTHPTNPKSQDPIVYGRLRFSKSLIDLYRADSKKNGSLS